MKEVKSTLQMKKVEVRIIAEDELRAYEPPYSEAEIKSLAAKIVSEIFDPEIEVVDGFLNASRKEMRYWVVEALALIENHEGEE